MCRRKIHLHGPLKSWYSDVIELEADTVAEAINGLCRLLKITPDPIKGKPILKVVGFNTPESIIEPSDTVDLHIVPAFGGGKGFLQIVIGVVLIAVAVATLNPEFAIAGVNVLGFAVATGLSMIIGGLMQLLAPSPKAQEQSGYLGPPQNTVNIGTPIPLLVGEHVAYGHYLSYNVDAVRS